MHPSLPSLDAPPNPDLGTALPAVGAESVPGPRSREWVDVLARHECPAITARRARRSDTFGVDQDPVVWDRAVGANVWDPDGVRFVDLTGGFGVCSAGQGNLHVREAVHAQVDRLVHGLGDAFPAVGRIRLAESLARITPGDLSQVIFGSSGSEAVEAALKTAVMATGRTGVVAFEGGYHGMSLGALAVSHYRESFRVPFRGRAGQEATFVPFSAHPESMAKVLDIEKPGAVIVEPIQGRGGDRTPPSGWLGALREITRERGIILIFDEIFTGLGRAGALFQSGSPAADGVVPDLLCLGKGLTSGYPLSACIGTSEVMASWGASQGESLHTSTFLGHPVGCAAALAVLDLFDDGLLDRAIALGNAMRRSLTALTERHPAVLAGVRGRGAMCGLEFVDPSRAFPTCRRLLEAGYLVLPAGLQGEVISFTPALTLTITQWQGAVEALESTL
jgi:4-aminobutyrate aminotransferase/(S)-3-amino-2-methylpropionate transaminase